MNFKTIVKPMLLKEEEYSFDSKEYLFEMKFDGIRALIYVSKEEFHIYNRKGIDITNKFPELKEIQNNIKEETIFDGEIILLENGVPNFNKLLERVNIKDSKKESKINPVCFVAFDILYQKEDLTKNPLLKRKMLLDKYNDSDTFIKAKYILEKGITFYQKIKKRNLEGMVAKKKDSIYEVGVRSLDWIKIKNWQREIFYIGGYSFNEDHSLLKIYLGEYKKEDFCYVGKVVLKANKKEAQKILKERKYKKSFFKDNIKEEVNYLQPKLTCYVSFLLKTDNNHLRQPIFKGLVN